MSGVEALAEAANVACASAREGDLGIPGGAATTNAVPALGFAGARHRVRGGGGGARDGAAVGGEERVARSARTPAPATGPGCCRRAVAPACTGGRVAAAMAIANGCDCRGPTVEDDACCGGPSRMPSRPSAPPRTHSPSSSRCCSTTSSSSASSAPAAPTRSRPRFMPFKSPCTPLAAPETFSGPISPSRRAVRLRAPHAVSSSRRWCR
jgi:hypothetical protein